MGIAGETKAGGEGTTAAGVQQQHSGDHVAGEEGERGSNQWIGTSFGKSLQPGSPILPPRPTTEHEPPLHPKRPQPIRTAAGLYNAPPGRQPRQPWPTTQPSQPRWKKPQTRASA